MFYSQFILAKKGPLGTIWIAAHLERKLRKNQVADTDIGVSVDSILFPEAPIALRMSSHLLLGVVRIYNRKVNYLFDDCSEALLNVKQAFRSTAVDLPPEESKAPYNSITLPEKFDLDDFELPDSDIFKGNYVDHHISSREQITLQDSMEGVSYSTSKFGLDERFGDGDASGLDLDEELFLNKTETAGAADESADPQTSYRSMTPLKPDEHPEDMVTNSETIFGGGDEPADVMDYAEAPSTPGLVEEPNLSNAKNASTCEDRMESEYHVMESNVKENDNNDNVPCEDKQEADWCSRDDTISDAVPAPQGHHEDNDHLSSVSEIKESESHIEFPTKDEGTRPTLEFNDRIEVSEVPLQGDLSNEADKAEKEHVLSVEETRNNSQAPNEVVLEKLVVEASILTNIDPQVSEGVSVKDQQKSCDVDGSEVALGNQVGSFVELHETQSCQEITISSNLEILDKDVAGVTLASGLCNSVVENPEVTKLGNCIETDADVKSDMSMLETNGREGTTVPGKVFSIISNSDQILTENRVQGHAWGEDINVAIDEPEAQAHNTNSQDINVAIDEPNVQTHNTNFQDTLVKNLNNITEPELHAPEKLLSVPEGLIDSHRDMLVEVSPSQFKGLGVIGDVGSRSAAGRKRSFTESTLTEQSLNSAESSRQVRFKGTTGSLPNDDDLLSSILAGRMSSILKVKPTPPLTEVTSMKRTRGVARSGAPKRKLLVDDTMVLHGDMIRHQLTNTEDIRRVRKKAPCTLAEISMIKKQHREDEIFLGTIFTGMSVELAALHGQTYDLSLITVYKDDVHVPSLDTVTEEARVLSQDHKNDALLETIFGANLTSTDDNHGASLETMAVSQLTSPHNEKEEGPSENNVTKINEQVGPVVENTLPSENRPEEVNYASLFGDFNEEEQTKITDDMGHNDLQEEPLVSAAEVGISPINTVTEKLSVVPEVDPLGPVQTNSMNEFSERYSHMNMDASADVASNPMVSMHAVELSYSVDVDGQGNGRGEAIEHNDENEGVASDNNILHVASNPMVSMHAVEPSYSADVDGGQGNGRREVIEHNDENEAVANDNILPDMVRDAAVEIVQDGTNHGESKNNLENEIYNITFEEQIEALFSGMDDGENPNQSEVYQPNMSDAGFSEFGLLDGDDIDYPDVGIDTEFLNVDDDDLNDIADDYIPDDEETQYADNSGWSSRTRAVSKYLQTAFLKEAECGKKSLSMDNLLTGKTRKEASRMFFETLVLKTRDYVHVEQPNPYDDITVKPRTSLMKSDF